MLVRMCAVGLNDVGYVGFDGDDTEAERGFRHSQSQIAESVASNVFPASLSYTLALAPDRSNPNPL